MGSDPKRTALVLSGGGVRGAYEVGVVAGIVEVLGLGPDDPAPFDVFTGTSVGAINATYFASQTHRGDLGVSGLCDIWGSLQLHSHLQLELLDQMRPRELLRRAMGRHQNHSFGWSVLDAGALQDTVEHGIDWHNLRANVDSGRTRALIVTALAIASGRTTMFADVHDSLEFRPSRDPHRTAVKGPIDVSHVLASAAIPMVFPSRQIGADYYCDGGLRFNTPIAPAIRCGVERLVIVPLLRDPRRLRNAALAEGRYPGLFFLVGKLLNALLADPVTYDLQILNRFNRMIEVLERTLEPHELERVQEVLVDARGAPYRRLDTLVIRPSEDIGVMAGDYLRDRRPGLRLGGIEGWLMTRMRRRTRTREADWASYVLFDGTFAEQLIRLGRRDARARADEIRAFFQ